jgi:CMP-N-acetylneuraminic acid synthetase
MRKNILGIIPARAGSQRVPKKNLRLLGGTPLVARAIESALEAKTLDRVMVSSDDKEVLSLARGYREVIVLRRPKELAQSNSPAIDYVKHSLNFVESKHLEQVDIVAIIQPSSPFTSPDDIDGTVNLLEQSGADSAVTIVKINHAIHPKKLKICEEDRLLPYIEDENGKMMEHELCDVFVRNGSVYVTHRQVIETGEIIGNDCRGYLMPKERSLDVNEEMDFLFAEFLSDRIIVQ